MKVVAVPYQTACGGGGDDVGEGADYAAQFTVPDRVADSQTRPKDL